MHPRGGLDVHRVSKQRASRRASNHRTDRVRVTSFQRDRGTGDGGPRGVSLRKASTGRFKRPPARGGTLREEGPPRSRVRTSRAATSYLGGFARLTD